MAISVSKRRSKPTTKTREQAERQGQDHHGSCLFGCPILCRLLYRVPLAIFLLFLVYLWSSSTTVISSNIFHICISSRKLNNLYCLSAGSRPGINIPVTNISVSSGSDSINTKENNHELLGQYNDPGSVFPAKNDSESASIKISSDDGKDESSKVILHQDLDPREKAEYHTTGKPANMDAKEENLDTILDQDHNWDFETGERFNYITFKNKEQEKAVKDVEELLQVQRSWRVSEYNKNGDNKNGTICDGKGIYVYDLPSKFNKDLVGQCDDMVPWASFCKFFENEALGEPIEKLGKGWYYTHQYSLEPIFHSRVLKHPCRVYDETLAKLFYVPFYGGLDILRWHFKNVSLDVKDTLGFEIIKWLESKKSWKRNAGKDHVFVLGKISWDFRRKNKFSWGSRFLELQEMQNPVKFLIERQPWRVNDIAVPHPTYFHPRSDGDIESWQFKIISSQRSSLVSFAGAARPDQPESIRSNLILQCKNSPDKCRFLNCTDGGCVKPESVMDLFLASEFCLQPPGDSPTRKSVFDSLISGCIPILFDPYTAYYQYAWHLPEDHNRYSVYINQEDVRKGKVNVVEKLIGVSQREREDMRSFIVHELLPGLVYGDSDSKFERFQDAFDISMNNLIERMSRLE